MRAASKKVAHCTRYQEFAAEECTRTRSKSNGQVETERQRQEQEVKGHVAESDVEETKPEGGQDKQLQELNEEMITEFEEAMIQQFREWGLCEAQSPSSLKSMTMTWSTKMQWFFEMLLVTHKAASNDCTCVAVGNLTQKERADIA